MKVNFFSRPLECLLGKYLVHYSLKGSNLNFRAAILEMKKLQRPSLMRRGITKQAILFAAKEINTSSWDEPQLTVCSISQ